MKESYGKGRAAHTGPESCAKVRKDTGEALTGVRAGQVSSRENGRKTLERRRCPQQRKVTSLGSLWQDTREFHVVKDPVHARKHLAREPGYPVSSCAVTVGRVGKFKDVRQR